jgi:hypothetical protein
MCTEIHWRFTTINAETAETAERRSLGLVLCALCGLGVEMSLASSY